MDGNRRWARQQNILTQSGHEHGYSKFRDLLSWAKDAGIKNLIVYALSTENLKRSKEEVSYILDLLRTILREDFEQIAKEDVRIIFAGDISRFPEDLQQQIQDTVEKTKDNSTCNLVVCAPYGGRAEIVHAVNSIIQTGVNSVTEDDFAKHLWTNDVPNPDLIIRTGGEKRLSNFLTWQSTYSELYFSDTYWPAFKQEEFQAILDDYTSRERRYGK